MLTQERLKQLLDYCPHTGLFYWREARTSHAGRVAGCNQSKGYVAIVVDQKSYLAHRLAWLWMTGAWPKDKIDHSDLNRGNNRWSNLREASDSQNNANMPSRGKWQKGVSLHRQSGLFHARAVKDGKEICLGYFKTPEEAHFAYCVAAKNIHGQFARAS